MAVEKFIQGKHDKGHHEGKRSELLRIAEAEEQVKEFGCVAVELTGSCSHQQREFDSHRIHKVIQ